METPFEKENNTTILYLEPVLDQNIYLNVLTLSGIPKGSLSKMTRQINTQQLSSFQTFSNPKCTYALTRYPNPNSNSKNNFWMLEEDIPSVFSYLQNNHYKIETELTEIMTSQKRNSGNSGNSGNRKIICVFSFISSSSSL